MPRRREDGRPNPHLRNRAPRERPELQISPEERELRQYRHTIKTLCQQGKMEEAEAIAAKHGLEIPRQYQRVEEPEPPKVPEPEKINPETLKGDALDAALTRYGLPKTGTADEKRARLKEALEAGA